MADEVKYFILNEPQEQHSIHEWNRPHPSDVVSYVRRLSREDSQHRFGEDTAIEMKLGTRDPVVLSGSGVIMLADALRQVIEGEPRAEE